MTRRPAARYVAQSSTGPRRQEKSPRADLLRYPNGDLTVLVRFVHDVDVARLVAETRWNADGPGPVSPLVTHRAGWFTTEVRAPRCLWEAADEHGRCVTWTTDDTARTAGAGVEFRPARRSRT